MEAGLRARPPGSQTPEANLWSGDGGAATVLDSAPSAFVSIGTDGRVLFWNRMAERTFGWPRSEALGRPLTDLIIPGRYHEAHRRGLQRYLATGESTVIGRRLELKAAHREGHELPVELTIAPVTVGDRTVFNAFLQEISERREAEAAVRLLASIVDSSQDAIVARDLDGTVRSWNEGAERLLGYSAEEMIGSSIAPVWREDRELFDAMQARLAAGEQVPPFDARAVRGDGQVIDVSVTPSVLKDGDGRPEGVSVIFRDISERRAAERASQHLAALVEGSDDAIMSGTLEGVVTSWNPGAERLYGYTAEEMIGESLFRVHPGQEALAKLPEIQRALAAGEPAPSFETTEVRKDGTTIDVSVSLSPIKDSDGKVTGFSSIVRDVSSRRCAEREAEEARRRFHHAFEGAPIGMALVSPRGEWLAVNPSLCRLLGRGQDELGQLTFQAVTHIEDLQPTLEQLGRALAGEIDSFETEQRYVRPDGALVWTQLSVSLLRDDGGEPLYFIVQLQDVTERRQAEEELARYTEQLTELAHQDPLTGLRNYRDFQELLDAELERSRRYESAWSIVLMDIDGFRQINAAGGHAEGDRVLREVAGRLAQASGPLDLAARIGSDEFALVLHATAGDEAERTAERIAETVADCGVSLCWGTASWPDDGDSKELVLLRADMRLRAANLARRGGGGSATARSRRAGLAEEPAIGRVLSLARNQLRMDVVYLTEIHDRTQTLEAVEGDARSFGMAEGAELPLDQTICKLMLDEKVPQAIPNVRDEPLVCDLPLTERARIGAYVGVPVKRADGRIYGTLCGASHAPAEGLGERDLQLLQFLGGLVSEEVGRMAREADARRAEAELSGIDALLSALLARDHYTGDHSRTVVRMATAVARRLGLDDDQVYGVEQVALLHDIGKVGIPDSILQKRGPLSEQEWGPMRLHPAIGARILSGTETLSHLAPAVKAEHERYDGSGYPDGLSGDQIPLASRITLACDAFHAMTSDRPYRSALTVPEACAELRRAAGSQFDPQVVEALLAVLESEQPGEDGAYSEARSSSDHRVAGKEPADVLKPTLPRQTPAWEPSASSSALLGRVRAACTRCGTHTSAVVAQAAMSGSCSNCGSYELELLRT